MIEQTGTGLVQGTDPVATAAPRHRTPRELSRSQWWLLVAMIAAAALLGALSPGAPTGHSWVDALYRAIFVSCVAMAASRARRWSLVVGSSIAAVASIGVGLIFACVALLMTVVLVWKRLRNRAFGACVGAFIGMACLRLEVTTFLGAATIVAVVAVLPILWSGYNVSSAPSRRLVRWCVAIATLVGVVGVGMAVYEGIAYAPTLRKAVSTTTSAITMVRDGRTSDAGPRFDEATRLFTSVADDSSAWWWFPARLVPVVSQNVEVIPVMSKAGASLTQAAATTSTKVDYGRIRKEGGGVDLAVLAEFREPVMEVADRLAEASDDVAGVQSTWVVGPLRGRIDEFEEKVDELSAQTEIATLALRDGPTLFGGKGERHYLVLLGNPAEARDLGGHIGNVAELSFVDGAIKLVRVALPSEISQPGLDEAVAESDIVTPSLLALRPATFPQNWGGSMNFPTDVQVAARLYANAVGHPIDGVMYADPYALAAMLEITGPVEVPGLGRAISSKDAVKFLTLDQFSSFPTQSAADTALTEFVRTLFDKLTRTTLPVPSDLGRLFGPLVKQGRFRAASLRVEDGSLLDRLGLDTGFRPTPGQDLLAVATRNANPSKIDAFLHRTIDGKIAWDPETGDVTSTISVTLRNDAPAAGYPDYVIGNTLGVPNGTNITDVAVITPFEATRATIDGVDAEVGPLRDGDVWRHTVRVDIPPGATVTVAIELEGEVDAGPLYHLRFGGQPLVNEGDVKLEVTASGRRRIVPGEGIDVSGATATAGFKDVGQLQLTLREESE